MEIKDRIIRIISSEGLTSAAFADIIGVQRSSISHIISGRNKPSLDFIQKILINYPKYKAEWLLIGEGDIYIQPTQSNLFNDDIESNINDSIVHNNSEELTTDASIKQGSENKTDSITDANIMKNEEPIPYNIKGEQKSKEVNFVDKIVIFYNDKTFISYNPSEL